MQNVPAPFKSPGRYVWVYISPQAPCSTLALRLHSKHAAAWTGMHAAVSNARLAVMWAVAALELFRITRRVASTGTDPFQLRRHAQQLGLVRCTLRVLLLLHLAQSSCPYILRTSIGEGQRVAVSATYWSSTGGHEADTVLLDSYQAAACNGPGSNQGAVAYDSTFATNHHCQPAAMWLRLQCHGHRGL